MTRRPLVAMFAISAACAAGDPPAPWDVGGMAHEVVADLRQYHHVTSQPREIEVLAWRAGESVDDRELPKGLPPLGGHRVEHALVWGRFEATDGRSEWLLIDLARQDREPWKRAWISREFKSPPPPLRPGESMDGEWPGYNRYAKPPTSTEVCEFANVSYLAVHPTFPSVPPRRVVTEHSGVRVRTWRRLTGEAPACAGWER